MRGINTGWCNYCNGNFCPCGSCGCSNNCSCSCGRKTVLQQSVPSCGSKSAGSKFCYEPIVYLTSNFIVLSAGEEIQIKVSNSSKLYVGQGIQIGTFYFQVTEIEDQTTIKITHDGLATPGANLNAINVTYGCYNYPIYYVGIVELSYVTNEITGVDVNYAPVANSVIDPDVTYTYGYLGPKKIQINLQIECEIDNTPEFVQVPLPFAEAQIPAVFSACIVEAGVPKVALAFKSGTNLIVGLGGGTNFTDGSGTIIKVSGEYGV